MNVLFVALLFASISSKSFADESFLLPQDIFDAFQKLDQLEKDKHCGGVSDRTLMELKLVAAKPPLKIAGYNSRMDNTATVPGASDTDKFFLRMSEVLTAAIFANDIKAGKAALDALAYWGKNKALTETKQCYSSKGLSKDCEKVWTQKDGQDPALKMDSSFVQKHINHTSYAYYSGLIDINPEDKNHKFIQNWLKMFESRNKKPTEPYFGLDFGWYWPAIFKNRQKTDGCFSADCPKKLTKKLVQSLNKLVHEDGSLKDRTTRGDRALHYHNEAMFEVMITLELARKFGVDIPQSLHEKVEKAGDIFINGFFDHSFMDKWAKNAFNAQYNQGKQRFKKDLNLLNAGTSWYFIFLYRYPESTLAHKINDHFHDGTRAAKRDNALGLGVGCVYRALSKAN